MNKPHIEKSLNIVKKFYNPEFDDNKSCMCGYDYHRHFDSYDDMHACGCKYCECFEFKEPALTKNEITWDAEILLLKKLININEARIMSKEYQMEG